MGDATQNGKNGKSASVIGKQQ